MEQENVLIEQINLETNYKKIKLSIQFWMNFLKKSWPFYVIMIVFTSVFVTLHVISGNVFQFYASIFYPIIMLVVLVAEGVYRNVRYLQTLEKELKMIQVDIYTTHLTLTNTIKGINHISELPYDIMENIFYVEAREEIVFEVRKKNYFSIPKKDIKEETFNFLTTLLSENME
ncbi:MAG: hypothetical protein K2H06_04210 [Anaeroplasmataceae bacterium]|nr:hypothetical protein [Anaeroplasmataceae bacterium]